MHTDITTVARNDVAQSLERATPSALALAIYGMTSGAVAVTAAAVAPRLAGLMIDNLDRLAWLIRLGAAIFVSVLAGLWCDSLLRLLVGRRSR